MFQLSKREIKGYLVFLDRYGLSKLFRRVKKGYAVKLNGDYIIYLEDKPTFVKKSGQIYPYIGIASLSSLPKIYVDEGAVGPITRGADVMAPGIVQYDEFKVDDLVLIMLVKVNSVLAIGKALIDSFELKQIQKGKVIINIHHIGDKFWKFVSSR